MTAILSILKQLGYVLFFTGGQKMEMRSDENLMLLKFEANWCGPCKAMVPIVEKALNDEDFSNIKLVSINIEEEPDAARQYGIRAIPTLLLVKDDSEVLKTLVGSASVEQVKEFLSDS
jgi:thioredoxin 1